ncbi:hypothetical protein BC830DRAFT_1164186 [Chytriomyces sp. MP71]|nr:hypothetical protein BC830DRAFT_1164186 [Chytriomyces sp. MP71]
MATRLVYVQQPFNYVAGHDPSKPPRHQRAAFPLHHVLPQPRPPRQKQRAQYHRHLSGLLATCEGYSDPSLTTLLSGSLTDLQCDVQLMARCGCMRGEGSGRIATAKGMRAGRCCSCESAVTEGGGSDLACPPIRLDANPMRAISDYDEGRMRVFVLFMAVWSKRVNEWMGGGAHFE